MLYIKISVALAACKGSEYISEQIKSILVQLGPSDEIIVSDDKPGGKTSDVVKELFGTDSRVKYFEGPGKGVVKNFESAISHCTGDIIFLSDQDDVWLPGKVDAVKKEIVEGSILVLHDAIITNERLEEINSSFFKYRHTHLGYWHNVIHNSYIGCCMAFSSQLKDEILPIPKDVPMHDQYIGIIAEKTGKKVSLINEPFILYRRKETSLTGKSTTLKQKIIWRLNILKRTLFK